MNRLETLLMGVQMKNPVIAASGTFGFGEEYGKFFDISKLGGISCKGLTVGGSGGNNGVRVWETPSGMLNSIGLENPGVEHFIEHELKNLREKNLCVIANLGGHSEQDYIKGAQMLSAADIDILELNISCPNVKRGGMAFGVDPLAAGALTAKIKKICRCPLLVKLSPNAPDITAVALSCEKNGADGLSLTNTFLGMAIDIKRKKPVFDNIYAGLSGSAIMPLSLRMVHSVAKKVKIPLVGMGGIMTAEDVLCFMMAGASAVQVGTATFSNPTAMLSIIDGLERYCIDNGLKNISEIVGIV